MVGATQNERLSKNPLVASPINGISAGAEPNAIVLVQSTQLCVTVNDNQLNDCNIDWTPMETLNDPSSPTAAASPEANTTYSVSIQKIAVKPLMLSRLKSTTHFFKGIGHTNMFTPNGNGHHDCFQVCGDVENFEVYIYDCWK